MGLVDHADVEDRGRPQQAAPPLAARDVPAHLIDAQARTGMRDIYLAEGRGAGHPPSGGLRVFQLRHKMDVPETPRLGVSSRMSAISSRASAMLATQRRERRSGWARHLMTWNISRTN